MSKHTPGPWGLKTTGRPGVALEVIGAGDQRFKVGRFADVLCIPDAWGDAEANASLIAAAPELLEACRDAVLQIRVLASKDDVPDSLFAAIAKAKAK